MKPSSTPVEEGFDIRYIDDELGGDGINVCYCDERLGTFYNSAKDNVLAQDNCRHLARYINNTMKQYIDKCKYRKAIIISIAYRDVFPDMKMLDKMVLQEVLK